jgi:hypothetical protein
MNIEEYFASLSDIAHQWERLGRVQQAQEVRNQRNQEWAAEARWQAQQSRSR